MIDPNTFDPDDFDQILVPTPYQVRTNTVDARGRITLGAQFADRNVTVAILEPTAAVVQDWPYDPLSHMAVIDVHQDAETDDRGRVNVGTDRSGEELTVAVIGLGERTD